MFRTVLLSTAAALGLTLTGAAPADAHPPVVPYPQVPTYRPPTPYPLPYPTPIRPGPTWRTWKVLYRNCDHDPWRVYAVYREDDDAYRTARHLRRTGYETRVVFDRGPHY
jgi:hypothetical protein